jgi:hypothetical protein
MADNVADNVAVYHDLEEVKNTILGLFDEVIETFKKAQDHPEQYQACADSTLLHWLQAAIQISTEHPSLSPLNDIISLLAVSTASEYRQAFRDQIWDVYDAVYEYAPLEPFLRGEFGDALNVYIHEVQSDDDTDGEAAGNMDV